MGAEMCKIFGIYLLKFYRMLLPGMFHGNPKQELGPLPFQKNYSLNRKITGMQTEMFVTRVCVFLDSMSFM